MSLDATRENITIEPWKIRAGIAVLLVGCLLLLGLMYLVGSRAPATPAGTDAAPGIPLLRREAPRSEAGPVVQAQPSTRTRPAAAPARAADPGVEVAPGGGPVTY
jgi:hypothetical protein